MKKLLVYTVTLAILYCASARGQSLANEERLEVITWNVEWFGFDHPSNDKGPENEELQIFNTASVLKKLGMVDVVVLEEICNRDMFAALADSVGYELFLSPGSDSYQKIGILYSPDLEVLDGPRVILYPERHQFAQRPPVYVKFNHPNIGAFSVIGIHLKAHIPSSSDESKQDSYDRRKQASELLLQFVKDSSNDERVIILGDWNDDVDVSNFEGKETPFKTMLESDDFRFVTEYLSYTFNESSKYGSIIDHICISDELFAQFRGSGIVAVSEIVPSYISTTSDHYPVFVVFE